MRRRKRSQRGFTLVELMVSLVLFSFAVAGVLAVAVSMAQGYREQRQIVDTESNARGALDYIADSLRMASPGVTTGAMTNLASGVLTVDASAAVHVEDMTVASGTCPQGSVVVTDGLGLNASDILQVVVASGPVVTTIANASSWTSGGTTFNVTNGTGLADGDTLLLTDGTDGRLVRIDTIVGNAVTLLPTTCSGTAPSVTTYPSGTLVLRAMRARFFLQDNSADGVETALMMDPDSDGPLPAEPLADFIEDFQVAVGLDEGTPPDGTIVATEWAFTPAAGTFTVGAKLKAIRVSLVARAAKKLVATSPSYQKPVLENHTPSTTFDAYRRRIMTSSIEIRNFGDSP